jgi:uncharacterized membrane protein
MVEPVSRAAIISSWLLSFVGLGFASYLTYEHYTTKIFNGCPDHGFINCQLVTNSAESHLFGIPIAVLGLATYLVFVAINSPWAWRSPLYGLHVLRSILVVGSMGFVLWLVYAELVLLNSICLYCTGVHLVTFALFVLWSRVAPTQLGWTRSATN